MARQKSVKNKKLTSNVRTPKRSVLAGIVVVSLVAVLGAYYFGISKADVQTAYANLYFITDEINNGSQIQAQPGMYYTTQIGGNISADKAAQAIAIISYDTRMVELVSTTCNHAPGCFASQVNTSIGDNTGTLHERRLAVCLNIPPTTPNSINNSTFLTLKFKSKGTFNAVYRDWISMVSGGAPASCSENIVGNGYYIKSGYGNCSANDYSCDRGVSSGISNGDFIGFTTLGNGTNQTGSHTGVSHNSVNNPKKSNQQSGANNKASIQSNTAPTVQSSTSQGTSKDPVTITPSPFYDGKQFSVGSDSHEIFGGVSVVGHKISYVWAYIAFLLALIAAISLFIRHKLIAKPAKR